MEKGIVVSPYFTFDGSSLHFPGLVGIEPEHLKFYILYWDKIDFPNNNMIHIGDGQDFDLLYEAGILQRTEVRFSGISGNIGHLYLLAQAEAVKKLNEQQPGKWILLQSGSNLYIPNQYSVETNTIEIELYNSLPCPGPNTTIQEILEFKYKRNDELTALRNHIDKIYLDIISSDDLPRAKSVAIYDLENSIKDLHAVADEAWSSKLLSGFKVDLNLPSLTSEAIKGVGLAASFGCPLSIGAALGAVSAAIKFEFCKTKKINGLPDSLKELSYINRINKELTNR